MEHNLGDTNRAYRLTDAQILSIEQALARQECVEIVPARRGAVIFTVRRREITGDKRK